MRIDWAASVLQEAGLTVVEEAGWSARGHEFALGPLGVILHHDASTAGGVPAHPSVIINGRGPPNPLPGPLSQWYLNRKGVWHVIASGRANHAGPGRYNGIASGNGRLLGVEAANNGTTEDWPQVQRDSYVAGIAAILKRLQAPSLMAIGHKEWATPVGRKPDPSFDMDVFRADLQRRMGEWAPRYPGIVQQRSAACFGTAPRWIRQQLKRSGHAVTAGNAFDLDTERAVKACQKSMKKKETGKVDQDLWAILAFARLVRDGVDALQRAM